MHFPGVTCTVVLNLFRPEIDARARLPSTVFAVVPMPETAVNEENLSSTSEDEVWATGYPLDVQSKAIAEGVKGTPYRHLWCGILALDSRHQGTALGRGKGVNHGGKERAAR